jgi:hypothetical protein
MSGSNFNAIQPGPNNFPSFNFAPGVGYTPLTAADLAFQAALLAAGAQVVQAIAALQLFDSRGSLDSNRTNASQTQLLSLIPQTLISQADCAAAGVVYASYQGLINYIRVLVAVKSAIAVMQGK